MPQTLARSFNRALLDVIPAYREAGERWPATARELAVFAINNGHWDPQPSKLVSLCTRDIARAMREERHVDPQGRTVRTMHAAKSTRTDDDGSETQLLLWDDIRSADREHMEVAFQQRRSRLLSGCQQLKIDVDSFNENNALDEPVQMVFDFTKDLEELERPGEYPPRKPR